MQGQDFVTVYWTPGAYNIESTSWTQLYAEPKSLLSELNQKRNKENKNTKGQNMFGCPSYVDAIKNVFTVNNIVESQINMPDYLTHNDLQYPFDIDDIAPLRVKVLRPPSIDGTVNINYNMSWLLFADEPLVARFTAPYFPATSPAKDVILSAGEFDIGQWFRDFNLDYHVPNNTKVLSFKKDQPLFYMDFKTNKKIILKRFLLTQEIRNFADECANSRARYGSFFTLPERYRIAKESKMAEQVLSLIKKNLVE
jgi:hypothetical protein